MGATEQDLLTRRRRVTNPEAPAQPPVAGAAIPDAAKQKILALMANNANQPLTTTAPPQGLEVENREQTINPYSQGNETRAAIVGKGSGAGRIQTMIDNPTREVNPDGSAGTVKHMSKKKAFLLGLLKGISTEGEKQGGHTWGTILGGGGAGAAIGAFSPKSIQEWQRRDDVATEQGLLNNQQKLGQQAANIEETQAQAQQRAAMPAIEEARAATDKAYKAAQIKNQQDVLAGRKTAAEAAAANAKAKMERDSAEKEKDRENARTIAGMPARERAGSSERANEREGQKNAAQDEFDQLTADETAAGEEKNRAYAYLEQIKQQAKDHPEVDNEDDLREATRAAETANTFYRSFGPKKTAAKSKATRYSSSDSGATASRAAPTSHSFSVSAYLSRNKGATKADAVAFAKEKYPDFEVVD